LIGKPEGKIPLETPRNTWKDDIVTYSGFAWLKIRILDFMIEFIGHLYVQQITTFTTWHTLSSSSTGHSLSNWTTWARVTRCYITSGRTPEKTRPFPNNGRLLYFRVFVAVRYVCRSVTQQWMPFYCWLLFGWNVFT
jgi:hypothetical protein